MKSMEATLPKGAALAPGEKSPMVVILTTQDGTVLETEGQGHGKVRWKDLTVTASLAEVNSKGIVSLPPDPRVSDGKTPHVTIAVPSHPEMHAELDVPVRYDYQFSAHFYGSSGSSGFDGSSGSNGTDGMTGSIDPEHPSAGGNGSDGGNGTDGDNGKLGGDGPPVQVRVALRAGSHPLLQVRVFAEGKEKLFLVDPQGGSLMVSSEGGSGGSGGKGGHGGRGGSGGAGIPSGQSGSNGLDGHDGMSGSAGNGGRITVAYDPQAKPFLSAIHLSNEGGPAPVFKEEPVAPLW
jgi:hypothetical protein